MLHNCSQPDLFYPERYLDGSDLPDPREVVFGFGRRSVRSCAVVSLQQLNIHDRKCPGRHFAETGIWRMISNIIATLEISRSMDDEDKEPIPTLEVTSGFIRYVNSRYIGTRELIGYNVLTSHPKPFSCSIRPRSETITSLVQEAKTNIEN